MKISLFLSLAMVVYLLSSAVPNQAQYPNDMVYTYEWYSYWCGSSSLTVVFEDGAGHFKYEILRQGECESVRPFDEEFEFRQDNLYNEIKELFIADVEEDQIYDWKTERYNEKERMCDGGGYNSILIMNFVSESHIIEHIVDDDTCSGTRTIKSHSKILPQLDFLYNYSTNVIDNHPVPLIETESEPFISLPYIMWFWPIFLVPLLRKGFKKK